MSFHKILERLREASKGQRGMKDSCSVSKYDLSELLCDFDRLDYQARLLVPKLESIEKERDEAQSRLDTLSTRFTALMRQNNTLAAENERLSEKLAAIESEDAKNFREVCEVFYLDAAAWYEDHINSGELPASVSASTQMLFEHWLETKDKKPVPADKPAVAIDEITNSRGEPEAIYLQLHDPDSFSEAEAADFRADGVTWCWHQINHNDVRYIRQDLTAPSHSQQSDQSVPLATVMDLRAYMDEFGKDADLDVIKSELGEMILRANGTHGSCPSHESEQP